MIETKIDLTRQKERPGYFGILCCIWPSFLTFDWVYRHTHKVIDCHSWPRFSWDFSYAISFWGLDCDWRQRSSLYVSNWLRLKTHFVSLGVVDKVRCRRLSLYWKIQSYSLASCGEDLFILCLRDYLLRDQRTTFYHQAAFAERINLFYSSLHQLESLYSTPRHTAILLTVNHDSFELRNMEGVKKNFKENREISSYSRVLR